MKSGYSVVWTNRAFTDLNSIFDYLESNWSDVEIQAFARKLDRMMLTINDNPLAFPSIKMSKNIRRCVVSNQTTIYYEIKSDVITIITLFDNCSNPNSLNL